MLSLSILADMAQGQMADLVKAVVDIGRQVMVIGGELPADEEVYLLGNGSIETEL